MLGSDSPPRDKADGTNSRRPVSDEKIDAFRAERAMYIRREGARMQY